LKSIEQIFTSEAVKAGC